MDCPLKTKFAVVVGGALLALSASVANAAGMGKLSVTSALGQPLSAEIELVSLQPGEFDAVTGRVASPEAYADARIEYSPLLRQLRFSTERRANGAPILKIVSSAPINEPFLDVLVEMNWPAGRLLREYPILLDPPGFNEARIVAPAATKPPVATATPLRPSAPIQPAATPTAGDGNAPAAATATKPAVSAATDSYGPVKSGDTLNKIAKETKSDTVSLEQMLVALYRENKAAFIGNNMNRLRTGQVLRVPAPADVAGISEKEARGEIKVQVANWNAFREQVAGVPSGTGTKPGSNVASGKITVAKPEATAPAASSTDQLKIAKTDAASAKAGGVGSSAALQDQVNALKEEKMARENALKEANSRVLDLEKQIVAMRKLAELKGIALPAAADAKAVAAKPDDKAMPKADTKAVTPVAPPVVPPTAVAVAAKPATDTKVAPVTPPAPTPTSVDAAKAVVSGTTPPADAKPADAKPVDSKPTDAKPAVDVKPADAKPADAKPAPAKKAPPPPPPPQPSFLEENMVAIGGVGAVLVVGIGGLLFSRRKKKSKGGSPITGMSSTSSIMPSDLKPNTVTGNKVGGLVDTGNSSFLTDFDKTGPGSIDTDEVDPLAEADVYIAYGRDSQAEEILKEALGRDKSRHEITLKLLEIYHNRKSAAAFEPVARELKDSVGESHPHWVKAASMGAAIDPQNPLYGAAANYVKTGSFAADGAAAGGEPPAAEIDFDLGFSDAPSGSSTLDISAPNSDQAMSAGGSDFDLDLNVPDAPATAVGQAAVSDAGGGLDFDLGLDVPSLPVAASAPAAAPKAASPSFDFDLSALSLDSPAEPVTQRPAAASQEQFAKTVVSVAKAPTLSDVMLELDLPSSVPSANDSGSAATKLELAKAYVEIGDSDGAKEILNEVLREGNPAQQAEAKKLIAGL